MRSSRTTSGKKIGKYMKILENKKGKNIILDISERLDCVSSPSLEKRLNELIESGERSLLVNFSNLEYISSAGLKVLLETSRELKSKGGKLLICCLSGMVKKVFEISGFNAILSIYENEKEALKDI